jgi:hypothetical protein
VHQDTRAPHELDELLAPARRVVVAASALNSLSET